MVITVVTVSVALTLTCAAVCVLLRVLAVLPQPKNDKKTWRKAAPAQGVLAPLPLALFNSKLELEPSKAAGVGQCAVKKPLQQVCPPAGVAA
jgi:hypothetical protein